MLNQAGMPAERKIGIVGVFIELYNYNTLKDTWKKTDNDALQW